MASHLSGGKIEQPWPSGLGTRLSKQGSCVRIPLRSRLENSTQGGIGCGEMDGTTIPHGGSCTEQDRGLIINLK